VVVSIRIALGDRTEGQPQDSLQNITVAGYIQRIPYVQGL